MMGVGVVPEDLNGSSLQSSRSASTFCKFLLGAGQRTLMGIISMSFTGDEDILGVSKTVEHGVGLRQTQG